MELLYSGNSKYFSYSSYIYWIINTIIVNTNKGIELINSIKDDLVYKICKLDEIVDGNPSLVKSSNRSSKRDIFFNVIDVLGIKDLVNKYVSNSEYLNGRIRFNIFLIYGYILYFLVKIVIV